MKKIIGMTFLEILIALVITGMILPSLLVCLNFADKYARHNANKTMALNYAQGLMEEMKNKKYEDLDALNGYTDIVQLYQSEDAGIQANRSVTVQSDAVYKKVKVTISWNWLGKDYSEEISTLRYVY